LCLSEHIVQLIIACVVIIIGHFNKTNILPGCHNEGTRAQRAAACDLPW